MSQTSVITLIIGLILICGSPLFSQGDFIAVKADGMQNAFTTSSFNGPTRPYGLKLAEKAADGSTAFTQSILITSPRGPWHRYWTGSSLYIRWNSHNINSVTLDYSTDNGSTWKAITGPITNTGSYRWVIPKDPTTRARVRVQDLDGDPFMVNPLPFVIELTPDIDLTAPNGGERIPAGSSYAILWETEGQFDDVKIEFSADGGATYGLITAATKNDGVYNWKVPNTISANCLIRVREKDGSPWDTSDSLFEIYQAPRITLISPNGGETLTPGSNHTITWGSSGTIGKVKIQYSADNGSSWSSIVSSTANDGKHSWTLPDVESNDCLVKITGLTPNVSDTSNSTFFIGTSPTLTLTSPNGGENWPGGSTQSITWNSSGSVGNVQIEYSLNNGSSWSLITSSTGNDGSHSWTVPNTGSTTCTVRVSETDSSPSDSSNSPFTIVARSPSEVRVSRDKLNFGSRGSTVTPSQTLTVSNGGGSTLNWAAASGQSWIHCSPDSGTDYGQLTVTVDPTALDPGFYSGFVLVSDTSGNSESKTITVNLNVRNGNAEAEPFGFFSTPVDGSEVSSSIPVTGWALDDIGIESVKIYRKEGSGMAYIGDAVFVEGARPDVEDQYADLPKNHKAGWGYMLLTHFLPGGGNGNYTLCAIAADKEGNEINLGSKTIHCDNANATKPFGAIDTPGQGGVASGDNFIHWGWCLAQKGNTIPIDGSTIDVYVDGVKLGNPAYNVYRSDIAAAFPGYANSEGATGYFYLDTTVYENGVHTIQWTVKDDKGNSDGIGSRYFLIENTGQARTQSQSKISSQFTRQDQLIDIPLDFMSRLSARTPERQSGNNWDIAPNEKGISNLTVTELGRVEIDFPTDTVELNGYMLSGERLNRLPIGSTVKGNSFLWTAGVGYNGLYRLVFIRKKQDGSQMRQIVNIQIDPR